MNQQNQLKHNQLELSYAHCRTVARTRARNFYYSFVLLSKPQRDAICAIYAFMRYSDDLSDEPGAGASSETMELWRSDLDCALRGKYGANPCWPAFHDAVQRYRIPHRYFDEMIDGVSSDLESRQIETWDELYRYCYQVASVVGLTITHIFGFDSPKALELAEKCGVAFQLTNIIRDVQEDEERGRSYLPREHRLLYPELKDLLAFEAAKARRYYEESAPLIDMVHRESRASLWALIEIYRRLLGKIEASGYDVVSRRISLTSLEKAGIVVRAMLR
ncbi:MAG: phytoene/squalene synthase family protein [Bryobacteraceae bacterium]|nr:phytoene/squalene synthase family protein [Bryobacteraceae bacterium]